VDQYQGARYEITVGAIFARVGCQLSHFAPSTREKHPEFIAKFPPTGEEVAVEVKSRHRTGVLHRKGEIDQAMVMRGDVGRLVSDALTHDPGDRPFMIFVDLNSPPTPGVDALDKAWMEDLTRVVDGYPIPTAETPEPFSLLTFTNFSYHYEEGVPASPGEYVSVLPRFVRNPIGDELIERLQRALSHYGQIPRVDPQE
jgi:hypothetical protein